MVVIRLDSNGFSYRDILTKSAYWLWRQCTYFAKMISPVQVRHKDFKGCLKPSSNVKGIHSHPPPPNPPYQAQRHYPWQGKYWLKIFFPYEIAMKEPFLFIYLFIYFIFIYLFFLFIFFCWGGGLINAISLQTKICVNGMTIGKTCNFAWWGW